MRSLLVFSIVSSLFFSSVKAQGKKSDFNSRYVYNLSHEISNNWSAVLGAQYRAYDFIEDSRLSFVDFAIRYKFDGIPVTLGSGYSFLHHTPYTKDESKKKMYNENRLFQDISLAQKINRVGVSHRFRLEERWREGEGNLYMTRYRYRMNLSVPVYVKGEASRWSLSFYDEIFLKSRDAAFDTNLLSIGGTYKINKSFSIGPSWIFETKKGSRENHAVLSISQKI